MLTDVFFFTIQEIPKKMNSGYNFDDTIDSIREDAAGLEMTYELPMEVLSHVEEFGISG